VAIEIGRVSFNSQKAEIVRELYIEGIILPPRKVEIEGKVIEKYEKVINVKNKSVRTFIIDSNKAKEYLGSRTK
jgi:N-methylhydantoinase B/oxoprolinase/acetone carboxylase alpha subunit